MRNEVNIAQLREKLLATVQQTMQPSEVGLWLVRPDQPSPQGDAGARQHAGVAEADGVRAAAPIPSAGRIEVEDQHTT